MTRHHESRTSARANHSEVSADVVQQGLSSGGAPLPETTRAALEPLFHHSFSEVRVFDDASAHSAASDLGAKAFTVGQNIAFGAGRFAPQSAEGQRLLLHELSHTVQQGQARGAADRLEVGQRHDAFEQGANAAVSSIARGQSPNLSRASAAPAVQLEEEETPAPAPASAPMPAAMAPHYELNLAQLQASGGMPLGAGSVSGQVGTEGAGFQLQQPNFNVAGGLRDWNKPYLDANGQLGALSLQGHYDPSAGPTAAAQYPFTGGALSAQFNDSGLHAQGNYGAFSANANYGAGGFDAMARYQGDQTKAWLGTSGAGVQTQLGPVALGASTDFHGAQANGTYTGNVLGQNLQLGLGAGGNFDGSGLNASARGTLLQPGGLPFNPWAQVKVGEGDPQITGGLGVKWE